MVKSEEENLKLLIDLNVRQQVYDTAKIPCVQKAWTNGQPLNIHGVVYHLENGRLTDLGLTLNKLELIPKEFWIYDGNEDLMSDSSDE